ncbi:MAG TPA: hypothetical protein VLE21_00985 [Candidatus Nitrosocosmicus sp.]|nr:hypothetical protein [Candidatus Nitrosocosmicus sp.]
MIDSIDELILSALSKDSKQDLNEIRDFLRNYGHDLSLEEIDARIKALEDEKIILRYTISIDTKKVRHKIIRVVLVIFRPSQHLRSRVDGLKK